jgi:CheY-like chemotaxis protein
MAREHAEELAASLSPMQASYAVPLQPAASIAHVISLEDVEPAELQPSGGERAAVEPVAARAAARALPEQKACCRDKRRVLVVDDDRDAVALMEEALIELGFSVAVAHDAPSALLVAKSFQPDTALVDIGLPIIDGLELGRRLRAAEAVPGVLRLVALTGFGRESDRLRSQQAGFDVHLVKPVALGALSGAVTGGCQRPFATGAEDSGRMINEHGG